MPAQKSKISPRLRFAFSKGYRRFAIVVLLLFVFFTANWILFPYVYTNNLDFPDCPVIPPEEYRDILNDVNITMDDPKLVRVVEKSLVPPSTRAYNFANKALMSQNSNPSGGQVQAVEDILRGFGGDGFFVECGANDGEWHSNSIWLERTLGWKGLLIEADPAAFAQLAKKNRNAWTGHFCLSNLPYPKMVITNEHVVLREGKAGLRKFMESKGYIFYRTVVDDDFVSGDSIFVHRSVKLTAGQKAHIGEEDSLAQRPIRA